MDVAAWLAVKILVGGDTYVIDGLAASSISALALQTNDVIDDVVLDLREADGAKVFVSAKKRTGSVAMGAGKGTFAEVVESMTAQYYALPSAAQVCSRFVWAMPSTAGKGTTYYLPEALKAYRAEMPVNDLSDFLDRRTAREREPLKALIEIIKSKWKHLAGAAPSREVVQAITSRIHIAMLDFDSGLNHERQAANELASYVVSNSTDGNRAWECLRRVLGEANRRGLKQSLPQLRSALSADDIRLKSELAFAADVECLKKMTKRNMARLREHRYLRFGTASSEEITLPRDNDSQSLLKCVAQGHRLLTGEPGCGKSGLVHRLVEDLFMQGCPVVLVLAEDFGGNEWINDGIPKLCHAWDDVLAHWPDGGSGYLITDALDAVREPEVLAKLKQLLATVLRGESNWTVIASVREFDLKHGQHLRELFPGEGASTHKSKDFAGVSHFHLGRLSEEELDYLVENRPEIGPFIQSARSSERSEQLHRSPFFLRLAADLLKSGVMPSMLADWNSPTLLLRRFWETRVADGHGEGDREAVLQAVCRLMMTRRSMSISIKELGFNSTQRDTVNDLRSRGILQGPALKHGTRVGDEAVRFSHHLLHDYVIAKSEIPSMASPFVVFTLAEPLAPVFYRQSFLMALDELWDGFEGPKGFWNACLELENCTQLHSFTRILAPLVAARRVTSSDDLLPLVNRIRQSLSDGSPAMKAALHLSSSLQDVTPELIHIGALSWCEYARQLGDLLSRHPALESPLVFLLDRLLNIEAAAASSSRQCINMAGRRLLEHHLSKPVNKGWRYAAATATRAICRTFECCLLESRRMLSAMLAPDRVALFPHEDLFDLSLEIKHLPAKGHGIVQRLFEVSFSTEPEPGEHRTNGSLILRLQTETRQDWNHNRYSLGEYYQGTYDMEPGLATTLVCIAWNAAGTRRSKQRGQEANTFHSSFTLRGNPCSLSTSGCSDWGRQFEQEENTILNSFEERLRKWCEKKEHDSLLAVVDAFAKVNASAVMWQTLLEIASEHPDELGVLLEEAVHEPLMLTMPAYRYGGAALFAALHKTGNQARRRRLERTLLSLTLKTPILDTDQREPTPSWIVYSQNVILGELDEANLTLEKTRELWRSRHASLDLERNHRPESLTTYEPSISDFSVPEQMSAVDPAEASIAAITKTLEVVSQRQNETKVTSAVVKTDLQLLQKANRLVRTFGTSHPMQAAELWGRLTQACKRIAGRRAPPKSKSLFIFIRSILLRAASDPAPSVSEKDSGTDDNMQAWDWPSPRSDAAEGLPYLVCRLKQIDRAITKALRLLVRDGSRIVRWGLARSIHALHFHAPQLMWELVDILIDSESKFRVLADLVDSLSNLLPKNENETLARFRRISDRAKDTPADHPIHQHLVGRFLFHYLRTGNASSWDYVAERIKNCDAEANAESLSSQLHGCRKGHWLTAGDTSGSDAQEDMKRERAWKFFRELLFAAQSKLAEKRKQLSLLQSKTSENEIRIQELQLQMRPLLRLVGSIATQLSFGSGTFAEKHNRSEDSLTNPQARRFWAESTDLFESLANELHPAVAHHVVKAVTHLMAADPQRAFLCAAKAITTSNSWGFLTEELVVDDIVKLVQRVLSDHREVLRISVDGGSECLTALLQILDLFVDAGWPKARQLTYRLEDIYR